MASVSNTFEGGTAASTITTGNSGGTSGDAFQFVSIVSGGSATYTSTAYRGSLAGQFSSGVTAGTSYAEYSTSVGASSSGQLYARLRFQMPSLPSDSTGVRVIVMTDGPGTFRAELRVTNAGAVSIRGNAGTALATFTDTYVAGTWWDVGMAILVFSTTVGQIEGKKYDGFGTVTQTITSAANQNTTGSAGTNKLQAGMIRSIASHTVLLDDVNFSTTGYPAPPSVAIPAISYGPWSGAVTDTSITAAYVLTGTTSARLVVSTNSGLTSPSFSSSAGPDTDGVVKLTVSGLTAGTQYYYGVECDGSVLAGGRGEAKTFPTAGSPANYSVAFGSCQFTVPSDSTFAAIAAKSGPTGRALQLIHMGDMHYRDWDGTATAADIFAQHMVSLGSTSMAAPLSKVPINYIWDNHDWGGDTSDATAAAGNIVAAGWRKVFPAYSLPATDGRGGHHSWVIGRVRFIQLDVRSYRDPQSNTENSSKTMLGAEQKAWFKARLSDPEPVKVICGNYPWRDDGNGTGRWGSYSDEFTELSDYIDSHVPGRVYNIFGDRHFLAADDGTASGTRGIPQAGGAPFQQATVAVPDTWSQGSYTITPSTLQAFGWLDITDDGDLITFAYSGITSLDSTTRVSMTTVFDTVINGTATVTGAGSVTATAVQRGSASVAGAGAVTAAATVRAGSTVTGVGSTSAAVTQLGSATVVGVGSVTAGTGSTFFGTASVTGAGTVSAVATQLGAAAVVGTGTVTATVRQLAGATVTGVGVVVASAGSRTTPRPNSGITPRPDTGITTRP